ncbi:MAG TPA: protein kinase [Kofleriaceae bacterium]|nr:protein kinase [Kofleriaceae bacterium]
MRTQRLGRYELLRHLASGGMARVYLARATGPGGFTRHVVVKTIPDERRDDDGFIAMFLDEARLVANLHHQHIAQVFDVDRTDDGTYFLAMEYVHGETVRHLLQAATKRRAKLQLDVGLSIGCAAAAGLHHAHERRDHNGVPLGIVHRDVSPSNVILGYDGSVKLIDFGIAKAKVRTTNTATGFIKGKAGYMAPEQARGYEVDRRSDVFALGVLVYELTTQTRAFQADTHFETMHRTMQGQVEAPSKRVPDYPAALEDVVMTALELDPDDRFQDAESMRVAFEQIARELGLALGDAPVMRALESLFPMRPEPWLAGAALSEVDDEDDDSMSEPLIMFVPPTPTRQRLARGTEHEGAGEDNDAAERPLPQVVDVPELHATDLQAVPEIIPITDSFELTTRPFERNTPATPQRAFVPVERARQEQETVPLPLVKRDRQETVSLKVRANGTGPESALTLPLPAAHETPLPKPPILDEPLDLPPPVRHNTPSVVAFSLPRAQSTTMSLAPRGQRRLLVVAGTAAATIIVAVIIAASTRTPTPAAVATTQATDAMPVPAPVAPPKPMPAPRAEPATAPTSVTVHVTTDPDGATVVLDGVRLGVTPFTGSVPIKPGAGWLKVRKRKYAAVKTRVSLERGVEWSVQLRRVEE